MITAYRWDAAARAGRWVRDRDGLGTVPTGDDVTWVDLDEPTVD